MDSCGPVEVHVRVRPVGAGQSHCLTASPTSVQIETAYNPTKEFTFAHVHSAETNDEELFEFIGRPAVEFVQKNCANCAVVTYGQTNSGKTHTWNGLLARAIELLCAPDPFNNTISLRVGCVQLHNDVVTDLLPIIELSASAVPEKGPEKPLLLPVLAVREDLAFQPARFVTQGQTFRAVKTTEEFYSLLDVANRNRAVAVTKMNSESSRGHVLLTIELQRVGFGVSKLCFVDLAGSERIGRSKVSGSQLTEAQFINSSLSALGNVVHCLATTTTSGTRHVPFRDSKLTRLLHDYLGFPSSRCFLILTVSPLTVDAGETISVLKFGERATLIQHRLIAPSRRSSPGPSSASSSRRQSPGPSSRSSSPAVSRGRSASPAASHRTARLEQMQRAKIDELTRLLDEMRQQRDDASLRRDDLQREVNRIQDENSRLRAELANRASKENQLELTNARLSATIAEQEAHLCDTAEMQIVLRRDNDFLHDQIAVVKASLADSEREVASLRRASDETRETVEKFETLRRFALIPTSDTDSLVTHLAELLQGQSTLTRSTKTNTSADLGKVANFSLCRDDDAARMGVVSQRRVDPVAAPIWDWTAAPRNKENP